MNNILRVTRNRGCHGLAGGCRPQGSSFQFMNSNVPNIISSLRIVLAPWLLGVSWQGQGNTFLSLLFLAMVSDVIDGYLARKFNITSELGARMDTWGDMAICFTVPLCAWWLIPDLVRQEMPFLLLVIGSYLIPIVFSLLKFRKTSCYHTWFAKCAAGLMWTSLFILFITEITWPFRVAALLQLVVALEGILITIELPELRSNMKSYWHLKRQIKHHNDRQSD